MTENQRSGLSDKAERFQKWSQGGNISGYAHFLSFRVNRRFYTKCSFIFWILLFFEEKYKAFFVISREAKKQMIFLCWDDVVLDRPPFDVYITYSVYWGTIK